MEQNTVKKEPLGKNFYVNVSHNHTFGTDAILLSNFASSTRKDRAVDLGTGCGIIPLIMLRDGLLESAVGVDISSEATLLAEQTKNELGLENFTVINSDLNDLKGKIEFGHHTLITCNPPYKEITGGTVSDNKHLAIARNEVLCNLKDVCQCASRNLKFGGLFFMVHRPERLCDIFACMRESGIEPKRIRTVHSYADKGPVLVLVEGKKGGNPKLIYENPLVIYNENGDYTDEINNIYGRNA